MNEEAKATIKDLIRALSNAGYSPEEIADVILNKFLGVKEKETKDAEGSN